MTVRVGIIGIGFMGRMHFETYRGMKGVRVAAICDIDPKKRSGDWSGIVGNIGAAGKRTDLTGVEVHSSAYRMIADPEIDVIDITLPTYLHSRYAIRALRAGKHVVCEKPIAINSREAARMVKAARISGKRLFIGHCIRFWPHYAVARQIVRSGRLGRVISACFRRFSSTPTWSWRNWLQNPLKSGLCALDMHIHDADFVLYCLGRPKTVCSHAAGMSQGRLDHILTSYGYGKGRLVTAEGGWEYAAAFPFTMAFSIAMEKGTLVLGPDMVLKLCRKGGGSEDLKVPAGDGYSLELAHFIQCIVKGRPSDVVSPESALQSLRLVEHEVRSAKTGKVVPVRL